MHRGEIIREGELKPSLLRLTTSQSLIWMGQQLNPDSPLYNMVLSFELSGAIDVDLFRSAFQALVEQSDTMRTVFVEQEDGPKQRIQQKTPQGLEFIDWSAQGKSPAPIADWQEERSQLIFDLSSCLFDAVLIKLAEARFIWYLNQHHLIIDAWGVTLQYKALAALYLDLQQENGRSASTVELPPFENYLAHQSAKLDQLQTGTKAEHWERQRKRLPGATVFYGVQKHKASTQSKRIVLSLGKERSNALRKFTQEASLKLWTSDLSLFNCFATLLFIFLHRVSGQQRLAIGSPAHNRTTNVQKRTPGLFMELFPLIVELEDSETFGTLFEKVKEETYSFLKNAQAGSSTADLSRGYNVVLNYINASFSDFNGIPMTSTWIHPNHADPGHDLRLQVHDFDNEGIIQLHFDLSTAIFDTQLQEQLPGHFLSLLDHFIQDHNQALGRPPLMDTIEKIAGPPLAWKAQEEDVSVIGLFEQQVVKTPAQTAIYFEGASLTYQQLNEQANQLAHFLGKNGVDKGDRVALFLKRSPEFMISVWAVMKVGAVFVPTPVNYPSGRVLGIIEDAGSKLVLTTSELANKISLPLENLIRLDIEQHFIAQHKTSNLARQVQMKDLAYLLYTSGSTGLPKGVMISHGALSHYIRCAHSTYVIDGIAPIMPLFTSLGFDLTITTLFLPLVSGGAVVTYPELVSGSDLELLQVLEDNLCNTIKLTPAHLTLLQGRDYQESLVRTMIVGGDNFKASLAHSISTQFDKQLRIYNEYGPTEATVGCIIHQYQSEDQQHSSVPIGLPIADTEVFLLDEFDHMVPRGITGEVHLAGPNLANGYWNQTELSKEKFLKKIAISDKSLYRTGDLARMNAQGQLEFLGRRDEQVKIGGRRVELEEIASTLSKYPAIQDTVVALRNRKRTTGITAQHNCSRCGLPSNYPDAVFDEQGVCHLCRSFKNYQEKVQKYFRNLQDFKAIFANIDQQVEREYDCIMLLSGGKDSTYALAQLVELGLKVLTFTLDNGYISEQAKTNIRRVVDDLGVDHVFGETPAMNEIFVDSLQKHCNVCDGCFKTIYTLSIELALKKNIPYIVTGLSRGQFFETRLTEELFTKENFTADDIDEIILEARKAYHQVDDAVKRLLDVSMFEDDAVFEKVQFLDFYRYTDVSLDEMYRYLDSRLPWVRPTDTGRSTNCLINQAGIFVHKKERGYSNYAFPYSWDVRVGHKTREASLDEINEKIDESEVAKILDEIGYTQAEEKKAASKQLVAYYTASKPLEELEMRNYLSLRLPSYMVPVQYIQVAEMPLTINGKINKNALPEPDTIRPILEIEYVAPRTDLEQMLGGIWSDILGLDKIGVYDDFIQIGGDSLAGIRLMARINAELELDLPIDSIFEKSTLASMAVFIEQTIAKLLANMEEGEE